MGKQIAAEDLLAGVEERVELMLLDGLAGRDPGHATPGVAGRPRPRPWAARRRRRRIGVAACSAVFCVAVALAPTPRPPAVPSSAPAAASHGAAR
jgi:hypothetical protein